MKLSIELTPERVDFVRKQLKKQSPKYDKNYRYYRGEHDILKRDKDPDLKNNKVVVNHCKRIVDINAGALFNQPVQYTVDENIEIEAIIDEYNKQTIERLDLNNGKRTGINGKSFEYVYAVENKDKKVDIRSVLIVPTKAFIKYDNSVERNKLWGCFFTGEDEETKVDRWTIVDDKQINVYDIKDGNITHVIAKSGTHLFGKVPMIEYFNNEEIQGDFDQAITLNDALNILQSDRLNDKEQLISAILALYGATVDDDDMASLKKDRVLMMPEGSKADYLIKPMDEASIEILKKSYEEDIYTVTMTPNLSDEKFAGNASGVSLQLKLIPFIQNIDNKKNFMSIGLDERFELYSNVLYALKRIPQKVDPSMMDIVFKHNLPQNKLEIAQIIGLLWGKVDRATLISWLPDVKNVDDILDALEVDEIKARSKYGLPDFGQNDLDEDNEQDE